jgi:outer membrane autotransporter protein
VGVVTCSVGGLGTGLVRLIVPSLRAGVGPDAVQLKRLLVVFLAGTWLMPVGAAAQTTNWLGGTAAYNDGANWSAGVPAFGGTAIFSNVGSANVTSFGGANDVGTWQFQPGASAYTFTVNSSLAFHGSGIVNNSSNAPTITNIGFAFIGFANSATAGNARITNNSFVEFDDTSTAGTAAITNNGAITFTSSTTAGNATIVNNGGGSLISFADSSTAGNATITTNAGTETQFTDNATAGQARLINAGGTVEFSGTTGPLGDNAISAGSIEGSGVFFLGGNQLTVGSNNLSTTVSGTIEDGGSFPGTGASLVKVGIGTLTLSGVNTYSGGTTINGGTIAVSADNNLGDPAGGLAFGGGALQTTATFTTARPVTLNAGGGTFSPNGGATLTLAGAVGGVGGLTMAGGGTLILAGASSYSGGTTVNAGTLQLGLGASLAAGGALTVNGGTFNLNGNGQTVGALSGTGGTIALGTGTLTTNSAGNTTLAATITGSGTFIKQGGGILALTGSNTYSGGTTVSGGLINFAAANNFGTGMVTLNGGGLQWATGNTTDISAQLAPLGAGGGIFDTNGNNVTLATAITGTGGLTKQGTGLLNLTGNNSFTGSTTVSAGTLAVNGSLASGITVSPGGTLGGNGTITGLVTNNGIIAPGNSIGTLNINGSFVQGAGGTYQVEVNNTGQGDRINAAGTAVIQGGTVQVLAQPGNYCPSTTYTIVRATGGVSGTYSAVTSNFAFLTPSLSYDANDVFLTLALGQNAFTSFSGITPNQRAVGTAHNQSFANASGDFATVIGALAGLNTAQGPVALDAISGQPYADFGTMNVNNAAMFMNALGQQMAGFHGGQPAGQRQALAQACEVEACDGVGPLSAWASALGGLGSVLGDGNASTLTYNFGGGAAGIDYRFDPRFLAGIGVGYTHGTQWVNSFMGQGWSDSVSVAAYGSFTQAGFYLDALAGYAYFNNQLQRQILIPGLQQRTATGSTGANQFLGQVEGGYKLDVYAPAAATITPFGRLQISSVTQNAFSESGAQSLSLNVAQQTTNSLRTTIGADLASSIGLGNERKLDFAVRLGWQHEFADTGRPITAAFAGAPGNSFTVFGATPARDSAVVGLQATTTIAAATQVYLRYDGGVGGGTDNHALNVGLRFTW